MNQEYDRIRGVDLDDAQRELDDSMRAYVPPTKPVPTPQSPASEAAPVVASREERARKILGVSPDAPFEDIRKSFERLNKRGDPTRFALNSVEREHAQAIQKSVQWAYAVLTANVDAIEKRFRSLEIE